MSMKWMVWALEQIVGDSSAKFVLVKLADNTNEASNICWPSIEHVAKQTELSERSVQRALKMLQDKKFISIELRKGPDGSNITNRYRLHGCHQGGASLSPHGDSSGGNGSRLSPGEGVRLSPKPSNTRTQKNLDLNPASGDALIKEGSETRKHVVGDYTPNEEAQAKAIRYWHGKSRPDLIDNIEDQVGRFLAHHRGTGTRMADWDSVWQTWYCNAIQYTKAPVGQKAPEVFEPTGKRGWIRRLEVFKGKTDAPIGSWNPKWGPPPGSKGCKVPPEAERAFSRGERE